MLNICQHFALIRIRSAIHGATFQLFITFMGHYFRNIAGCLTALVLLQLLFAGEAGKDRDFPDLPVPAVIDSPLRADSLPQAWTYTPENFQQIPGGPSDTWWRAFSDPLLDSLITTGVAHNYNLAAAHRRMNMARAAVGRARAAWFPIIGVSAGYTATQPSGATARTAPAHIPSESYFSAGLNASWEIDIFGKVASSVKAQKASYRATRAEYAATMVQLTAQIASTYFTLRSQQRLLQVAKAHAERQMKIVKMAQARFEATLASKLDIDQAWQTYYSTIASIPQLESSIQTSINALGILIGDFPAEAMALLATPAPLPNWKPLLPGAFPADLLRRRPDIAEAEQQLAAAAANVGVAKKDFLPTLSIQGSIGTSSRNIDHLFGSHSLEWAVAPTLSWTIFDGFARKYTLVSAKEALQAAVDSYNMTVTNAIGETDSALKAYGASLDRIGIISKLCATNEEALSLAIERYRDSLSPMTDVVNAQLNALAGESDLVSAHASALTSLVTLYEALGGGYE